ncbi:MAG: carbon storage regulator [Pirellulaceae bacterium]
MLVLTRKLNEEILIGDNVKVTLIRVRGNTVRIGIEAPKEVRIVRGELEPLEEAADDEGALSEREHAFAHPALGKVVVPPATESQSRTVNRQVKAATPTMPIAINRITTDANAEIFVGTVNTSGGQAKIARVPATSRAPLANFVSAS